jgi:hypothetical protein
MAHFGCVIFVPRITVAAFKGCYICGFILQKNKKEKQTKYKNI